jgi:hypothetical protein
MVAGGIQHVPAAPVLTNTCWEGRDDHGNKIGLFFNSANTVVYNHIAVRIKRTGSEIRFSIPFSKGYVHYFCSFDHNNNLQGRAYSSTSSFSFYLNRI